MSLKTLSFKQEITTESLSSHGGLILLCEYLKKLGILNKIDCLFGKPGSNNGYNASHYIGILLLKFHGGGNSLEDIRAIRDDSVLRRLLSLKRFPTSYTLGEWLRRKGWGNGLTKMFKLNKYTTSLFLRREERVNYTLDIDASEIIGNKHKALYTYKKNKGYMPIIGHLAENGLIIGSDFRSGNISPGSKNYEFMLHCIRNMPEDKKIRYFRADSASYQASIINYCNDNGIYYAIGGDLDSSTMKAISTINEDSWQKFDDGEISETPHMMNQSNHYFRLIVKRKIFANDLLGKEYKYYVIISNRKNETAAETRRYYNQRGEASENRIKELKLGFNLNRLPCGQHNSNAMYFYIGCLAYNLSIMMKYHILPKKYRKYKIATLRWKLYQMPVKLVKKARFLYLKIQKHHFRLFEKIKIICQKLQIE